MKISLSHTGRGYIHILADNTCHRYNRNQKKHWIYLDGGDNHDPLSSYDLTQKTAILEALRLAGESNRIHKGITISI